MDRRWDDMLDEFRALGGTADNICLKEGRFGRGLFPCDPAKPIRVHIPCNLLIAAEHYETSGDRCRIAGQASLTEREKSFLEDYQRDFAWGSGARQETVHLLDIFERTPPELCALLENSFRITRWFGGATPEKVRERFFGSRMIKVGGRDCVMPIIELANHGSGTEYDMRDGVALAGQFPGEILVRYYSSDSLEIFKNWGFVSEEDFALSLPTGFDTKSGQLIIGRNEAKPAPGSQAPFFPAVRRADTQLTLSYMLLGHKKFPRLAKGMFYRIMRDAGRGDVEEGFDVIHHLNRLEYLRLLELSDTASPKLASMLRRLVHQQLTAMSFAIGARQIQP